MELRSSFVFDATNDPAFKRRVEIKLLNFRTLNESALNHTIRHPQG